MLNEYIKERQIPCDFTHMCNMKQKQNKQKKNSKTKADSEADNKSVVTRGEVGWSKGETCQGVNYMVTYGN